MNVRMEQNLAFYMLQRGSEYEDLWGEGVMLYPFVHALERVERGCGCGVLVWFLH